MLSCLTSSATYAVLCGIRLAAVGAKSDGADSATPQSVRLHVYVTDPHSPVTCLLDLPDQNLVIYLMISLALEEPVFNRRPFIQSGRIEKNADSMAGVSFIENGSESPQFQHR